MLSFGARLGLFAVPAFVGSQLGSGQAEAAGPQVPIFLLIFILAALFLIVRMVWGFIKSRRKAQP